MYISETKTFIFAIIYVVFVTQEITNASMPEIISRSQWGARSPKKEATILTRIPAPYVIIHHSATGGCETQDACESKVRAFQNYHMDTKGWDDIGYNFVVGEDGNIYEGRGWDKQGAHSKPFNNRSIGICIVGDFMNRTPNQNAIQTVNDLIENGVANDKIKDDYELLAHRQTWQTTCPGNRLYDIMKSWPHWVSAAS